MSARIDSISQPKNDTFTPSCIHVLQLSRGNMGGKRRAPQRSALPRQIPALIREAAIPDFPNDVLNIVAVRKLHFVTRADECTPGNSRNTCGSPATDDVERFGLGNSS